MKRYMAHILVSAEKITEHFLKVQVHDEGTLADGGMEGLVVDVKPTVFALRAALIMDWRPLSVVIAIGPWLWRAACAAFFYGIFFMALRIFLYGIERRWAP